MNSNFKISIITVSFNSQNTLRRTIESVLSQNYDNIEFILIDGGSTDWTLDIIDNYKDRINFFISEPDKGIYDAMNKGIIAASGDIIGILNSDDFYTDETILKKVADKFHETTCDAAYGDLLYVKSMDVSKIFRYWKSGSFSVKKLRKGWMLPHPTFFVKKSVYEKYGLYNTQLNSASDYEMILRLLYNCNIKVNYMPLVMVKMRVGGTSNANLINRFRANKEDAKAWELNNLDRPMFIRFLKPLQKIKQFFLRPKL